LDVDYNFPWDGPGHPFIFYLVRRLSRKQCVKWPSNREMSPHGSHASLISALMHSFRPGRKCSRLFVDEELKFLWGNPWHFVIEGAPLIPFLGNNKVELIHSLFPTKNSPFPGMNFLIQTQFWGSTYLKSLNFTKLWAFEKN
jgi:hypothetical protein